MSREAMLDDVSDHNVGSSFVGGTLIRTLRGDVPIEELGQGDLIVTTSEAARHVKCVRHLEINCLEHPDPTGVYPVRVATNAFDENRPSPDLLVSPCHSICVPLIDQVLIRARHLINGSTVDRVQVNHVSYWQLELDKPDIVIANNLPAESYLEKGDRCGPPRVDGPIHADRYMVEFVRERLKMQAKALGWVPSYDVNLHLVVDGAVRRPLTEGEADAFLFPGTAVDVRLRSNVFVPSVIGSGVDSRVLGISMRCLVFAGSHGGARSFRQRITD
jgi:hypothetical protein